MNMKDMIQRMTDIENESKQSLTESRRIQECPPNSPTVDSVGMNNNSGTPVSVNVNLTASGKEHVEELLSLMKAAGLEQSQPVSPEMMPMRQDMDRLHSIVNKPSMEDEELDEYANEPDPEYSSHTKMTSDLSGGINRKKKSYKATQDGDNPMNVDNMKENIKLQLLKALEEKKSKPDYLDMDKDGNKKEPMKKAIADKKKKGPVKEATLKDFKRKAVPGLYNFDHFEASDGSFIQVNPHGYGVYKDADGNMHEFNSIDELKKKFFSAIESVVSEISSDLAKRYTKNAKVDRDNTDHILKRDGSTNDWKTNQELQKRNSKRTKGINQAKKRM